MIIIPIKWLFHWEYTLFSDKPRWFNMPTYPKQEPSTLVWSDRLPQACWHCFNFCAPSEASRVLCSRLFNWPCDIKIEMHRIHLVCWPQWVDLTCCGCFATSPSKRCFSFGVILYLRYWLIMTDQTRELNTGFELVRFTLVVGAWGSCCPLSLFLQLKTAFLKFQSSSALLLRKHSTKSSIHTT